ncbi:MAG TPA: hypothetical protein VER11_14375 [Polyangiaceae bacterium]|nr:hypothetical protein [Polyangiaceae bacterium]
MILYPLVLFFHIVGALGLFAALVAERVSCRGHRARFGRCQLEIASA